MVTPTLYQLNQSFIKDKSANERFSSIYNWLRLSFPAITRMNIVSVQYGVELHTSYVADEFEKGRHCDIYKKTIQMSPKLKGLFDDEPIRVVDDLQQLKATSHRNDMLIRRGHKSSFTFAFSYRGTPLGIIFLNSDKLAYFSSDVVSKITPIVHTIFNELINHNHTFELMNTSLNVALKLGSYRDPETAEHLERMTKYSELIARNLSDIYSFSNLFIIQLIKYARFHDIGKFRVPDAILFSTERYNDEQRRIMNKHVDHGTKIINQILNALPDYENSDIEVLLNIIGCHHERFDGVGYPKGIAGIDIPLEARIAAVADVFDALMSKRPYKKGWSFQETKNYMEEMKGKMFDPACIDALFKDEAVLKAISTDQKELSYELG